MKYFAIAVCENGDNEIYLKVADAPLEALSQCVPNSRGLETVEDLIQANLEEGTMIDMVEIIPDANEGHFFGLNMQEV